MDSSYTYEDAKLTNCSLFEEDEQYYLRATYHCKEPNREYDLVIPRILFHLPDSPKIKVHRDNLPDTNLTLNESAFLEGGNLSYQIFLDGEYKSYFWLTNIEEEIEEVTMEDVEKKFGHKVKIVKEKSE